MKVFQIGFNRCGTRSLYQMFKNSGVPSIHWGRGRLARQMKLNWAECQPLLKGYENFKFYSDMEDAPHFYAHVNHFKHLNSGYPGSKFILNIRDKNKWLLSRLRHKNYCESCMRAYRLSIGEVVKRWSDDWDKHIENVKEYFELRDNLLVFNIEKEDIGRVISFIPELPLNRKFWQKTNQSKVRRDNVP